MLPMVLLPMYPNKPGSKMPRCVIHILFGKPYDEAWYKKVVIACSLVRDFELLEAGDMTEIGEKGLNLRWWPEAEIVSCESCLPKCRYHYYG